MKLNKNADGFELDFGLMPWKRFLLGAGLTVLLSLVALKLIELNPEKYGELIIVALLSYFGGLMTFYFNDHDTQSQSDITGETPNEKLKPYAATLPAAAYQGYATGGNAAGSGQVGAIEEPEPKTESRPADISG